MSGYRILLSLMALFGFVCGRILAAPMSENRERAKLILELRDGARLIGKSADSNFKFQSDVLGKISLPIEKIRSIETTERTNSVRLITSNSDALAVHFAVKEIRLETDYGKINVPVGMIKRLQVSAAGKAGRPTAGLLGLWSGENNTVNSVTGKSEANHNVTFTDGVAGRAFSFDPGLGFYTGIPVLDEPKYALTNSMTIEGWIRPRGDGYVIFYRGDHRPGLDPYALSMRADHRCSFGITDNDGNSANVETMVPYYQWTHVAATLDGESSMIRIFTNGMLAAENKTDIRPFAELLPEQSPGVGIGNVNDGGNNFPFVGDIDEIAIYDRALGADEIQGIFKLNAGNASEHAGPFQQRLPLRHRLPVRPGHILDRSAQDLEDQGTASP